MMAGWFGNNWEYGLVGLVSIVNMVQLVWYQLAEQPAVAEMPTHSFVQPATRLKP